MTGILFLACAQNIGSNQFVVRRDASLHCFDVQLTMLTVIETDEFHRQALSVWNAAELDAFIAWIAANPEAGNVIPGAHGARKVRWSIQGQGKRGGARVIYFNVLDDGFLVLLAVYVKAARSTMSAGEIRKVKSRGT